MRQLTTAIIVFLSATVIVLATLTVYLTYRCRENAIRAIEAKREAVLIEQDRREILADNISLYRDIDAMQKRIDVLTAANKALLNRKEPEKTAVQTESEQSETVSGDNSLLPSGIATNIFRFEGYYFHPQSDQARLQAECSTDPDTGIRIYTDKNGIDYYCAALGMAYGTEIGLAYSVKLNNGTEFNIVLADFKHDISQPKSDDYGDSDRNYDGQDCINVIEFVCNMRVVPGIVKVAGTMSALARFGGLYGNGGNIAEIEYIGRKWK